MIITDTPAGTIAAPSYLGLLNRVECCARGDQLTLLGVQFSMTGSPNSRWRVQ
jgi:hypothetical protein